MKEKKKSVQDVIVVAADGSGDDPNNMRVYQRPS